MGAPQPIGLAGPAVTDLIGAIPYRVAFAGGWIDQPFVSRLNPTPPGSMVVVSLEPLFPFMERCKYSALEDGPTRFTRGYTCPALLGNSLQRDRRHFAYGTITPCGGPFQDPSAMRLFDDSPGYAQREPHNPATACNYGLGCSRFARHYCGNLY